MRSDRVIRPTARPSFKIVTAELPASSRRYTSSSKTRTSTCGISRAMISRSRTCGDVALRCNACTRIAETLLFGKTGESFVFTRSNGQPVRDFRGTWAKTCAEAGMPGLLFHDLRRTAARNLRRAGVAEGVIMKIGGWRTRSVFERYAIVVSQADIAEALGRLELRDGHSLGHSEPSEANLDEPAAV